MLDLHAVENAAVGVDPNKELPRWFEIAQNLGRVAHTIQAQSRRPDLCGVKHLFRYQILLERQAGRAKVSLPASLKRGCRQV
jgi:hypothetical protein